MFKQLFIVPLLVMIVSSLLAEVTFPKTRNAVGPGEYYLLDEYQDWESWCVRDEDGEDSCHAATTISDLDAVIKLDFSVSAAFAPMRRTAADVDIVPRGYVSIEPYSKAEHYQDYSAKITSVDGQPFDSFWCEVTDYDECKQGPDLNFDDLRTLLRGRQAEVTILGSEDEKVTTILVSLMGITAALRRADEFELSILDIKGHDALEQHEIRECTLHHKGQSKLISHTYDEVYDARITTFREIFRGPRDGGDCPSYIALAYLTPKMTNAQRKQFCLVIDGEDKGGITGFQQGLQDAYRRCKEPSRSFCEVVEDSKEAAKLISNFSRATVVGISGFAKLAGVKVVAHSSGAAILTGSGGYMAGTLGAVAATVAVLLSPYTATAATVTVVAVSGAVYVCK